MRVKTMLRPWGIALCTALILGTGVTTVQAQERVGRWEFNLGTFYQLGTDIDVKDGSAISTDDDFGLNIGAGYNFTDMMATSFGIQWAGVDYKADVTDENGDPARISGTYDSMTLYGNFVLNFGDGPWVPYIGAGIGWTWIDTNVPNGPPIVGCWWDPWYGYVCWGSYPTKTKSSFSYQAFVGLRYEFPGHSTFMRFAYTSQWMDFSNTDGTPRFDLFSFDFGWMF